jgi:hypothetical protein
MSGEPPGLGGPCSTEQQHVHDEQDRGRGGGAETLDAINEAIRLRDKVLLVLSEGAIASDWVEGKVTRSLDEERERQRQRTILFPIRIDDTVLETKEAWTWLLRGQRHIGDFTRWKEHDTYRSGLERLLRDLKVEASPATNPPHPGRLLHAQHLLRPGERGHRRRVVALLVQLLPLVAQPLHLGHLLLAELRPGHSLVDLLDVGRALVRGRRWRQGCREDRGQEHGAGLHSRSPW